MTQVPTHIPQARHRHLLGQVLKVVLAVQVDKAVMVEQVVKEVLVKGEQVDKGEVLQT